MTATGDTPALEARNLYRFFRAGEEETLALRGVSLTVHAGATVAVLGPSGSGKSTLLHCLAGLDEPDGGTVFVRGERLSHRPEAERARIRAHRIGVLLQGGNLLQHLDVRGNVRVAQLAYDTDAPRRRVDDLLEQVSLAAALNLGRLVAMGSSYMHRAPWSAASSPVPASPDPGNRGGACPGRDRTRD